MPVLMCPDIAARVKQKWLLLHPEDREDAGGAVTLDDSLTSLTWLQNFSILSADPDPDPGRWGPPAGDAPRSPEEEVDYRTDPLAKPPHSYATLICMAMRANPSSKIPLSAIYTWISDNFSYYRHAEPSWQNSIRHNLSLNKCFRKVPRRKDEPGKGGFWQIDPQYADMFVDGVFKRRRMPTSHPGRRRHRAAETDPSGLGAEPARATSPLLAPARGDFDLASVFDDVLRDGSSAFEDLDIDSALSSLGCGAEPLAYRDPGGGLNAPGQLRYYEGAALFSDQQCWPEVKEEVHSVPLTTDQGFGFTEGFFPDIHLWERAESYM